LDKYYRDALDLGKTRKAKMREAERELDNSMRTLRDYVNEVADGDVVLILSTGFDVSKVPAPIGPLPQVEKLESLVTKFPGTADLRWSPVKGSRSYVVELMLEPTEAPKPLFNAEGEAVFTAQEKDEWRYATSTSRGRATLGTLLSARYYWFRVAAIGAAGQGPYSNPIRVIVG
jgi:hypothetical protein